MASTIYIAREVVVLENIKVAIIYIYIYIYMYITGLPCDNATVNNVCQHKLPKMHLL